MPTKYKGSDMKATKSQNISIFLMILFLTYTTTILSAYDRTTIYSQNDDFSYGLDLNAVASIFGKSYDLEDFEQKLNDPYNQISNLDLDGDGYVDYLRVIEVAEGNIRLVVIQASIGRDLYQDIATIEVTKDRYQHTSVQIVGDSHIYGYNYIVEPTYIYRPHIYTYFWSSAYYNVYRSHYRWGYYPNRYRPWRTRPTPYYKNHIKRHIDERNRYRYTRKRRNREIKTIHNRIRRDDLTKIYPHRSRSKVKSQRVINSKSISSRYKPSYNTTKRRDRSLNYADTKTTKRVIRTKTTKQISTSRATRSNSYKPRVTTHKTIKQPYNRPTRDRNSPSTTRVKRDISTIRSRTNGDI